MFLLLAILLTSFKFLAFMLFMKKSLPKTFRASLTALVLLLNFLTLTALVNLLLPLLFKIINNAILIKKIKR